jgi:hypothetical protein
LQLIEISLRLQVVPAVVVEQVMQLALRAPMASMQILPTQI